MPQTCFYSKMAISDISMYDLWLRKESDTGQTEQAASFYVVNTE
jgi:hypothetical protein